MTGMVGGSGLAGEEGGGGRARKTLLNFCVMDETAVLAAGLPCVAGKTEMGQAGVVFLGVEWNGCVWSLGWRWKTDRWWKDGMVRWRERLRDGGRTW